MAKKFSVSPKPAGWRTKEDNLGYPNSYFHKNKEATERYGVAHPWRIIKLVLSRGGFMDDPADKFMPYEEEAKTVLSELHKLLIDVLNSRAEPEALTEFLKKWEEVRQKINNEVSIGVLLGVKWEIALFLLTGDIREDVGQINFRKLEGKD